MLFQKIRRVEFLNEGIVHVEWDLDKKIFTQFQHHPFFARLYDTDTECELNWKMYKNEETSRLLRCVDDDDDYEKSEKWKI